MFLERRQTALTTGLPSTLGGACPLPGGGRGQAGSQVNRPRKVSRAPLAVLLKGLALAILLSGCASSLTSADANCFPIDTGDKICADDSWRTAPSTFDVGSAEHSSGDVIDYYYKESSFESKGLERSTYLASVTTNNVNGTLCDQSRAFDECRSTRRFTLSEGSVTSVFLTKTYANRECRTLNIYQRTGISEFTACGRVGSDFFDDLNLRAFANSVRQEQT
jgi:hypothetical protein